MKKKWNGRYKKYDKNGEIEANGEYKNGKFSGKKKEKKYIDKKYIIIENEYLNDKIWNG